MKTFALIAVALMTGCAANVATEATVSTDAEAVCAPPVVTSCVYGNTRYHVDATSHAAVDAEDNTTCQVDDGSLWIFRAAGETIHLGVQPADHGYRVELCYTAPVSK